MPCESCDGLNTSCPDGCERLASGDLSIQYEDDPVTLREYGNHVIFDEAASMAEIPSTALTMETMRRAANALRNSSLTARIQEATQRIATTGMIRLAEEARRPLPTAEVQTYYDQWNDREVVRVQQGDLRAEGSIISQEATPEAIERLRQDLIREVSERRAQQLRQQYENASCLSTIGTLSWEGAPTYTGPNSANRTAMGQALDEAVAKLDVVEAQRDRMKAMLERLSRSIDFLGTAARLDKPRHELYEELTFLANEAKKAMEDDNGQ